MTVTRRRPRGFAILWIAALAASSIGCGQMTIRTWAVIDEENSGGQISMIIPPFVNPIVADLLRLQGGFLTKVVIRTSDLPFPMGGTVELEDLRMGGAFAPPIGKLCTWNDPDGASVGDIEIDLLGGTTTTTLFMDALATTQISQALPNVPNEIDFEQAIDLDLGAGLDIATFLDAFVTGDTAGLFSTTTELASVVEMGDVEATFSMNVAIVNDALPPLFDADILEFCGASFEQQGFGKATFYGVNAKSSYLRKVAHDNPADPLVLPLAEVGAAPGDLLRLQVVGSYAPVIALKDGNDRRLSGVFSSTDEVLDAGLFRVPGAIQSSAPKYNTWLSIVCLFGECNDLGGDDIPEDFLIYGARDVVVPPGASYLILAPVEGFRIWVDNTGMGLGVTVEVNPGA